MTDAEIRNLIANAVAEAEKLGCTEVKGVLHIHPEPPGSDYSAGIYHSHGYAWGHASTIPQAFSDLHEKIAKMGDQRTEEAARLRKRLAELEAPQNAVAAE